MSKLKYKTAQEVTDAIYSNRVKRNSVMVMKRQYKLKGNLEYASLLQDGVDKYDSLVKDNYYCSYYNKNINNLSLYELVKLDELKPSMFTYYHKVKYSTLMLGAPESVESYRGNVMSPSDFNQL